MLQLPVLIPLAWKLLSLLLVHLALDLNLGMDLNLDHPSAVFIAAFAFSSSLSEIGSIARYESVSAR